MSMTHHTADSASCVNHIFHNNEMYIIIHILHCNYELCYCAQIEDNSRLSSHLALAYHTKKWEKYEIPPSSKASRYFL